MFIYLWNDLAGYAVPRKSTPGEGLKRCMAKDLCLAKCLQKIHLLPFCSFALTWATYKESASFLHSPICQHSCIAFLTSFRIPLLEPRYHTLPECSYLSCYRYFALPSEWATPTRARANRVSSTSFPVKIIRHLLQSNLRCLPVSVVPANLMA